MGTGADLEKALRGLADKLFEAISFNLRWDGGFSLNFFATESFLYPLLLDKSISNRRARGYNRDGVFSDILFATPSFLTPFS